MSSTMSANHDHHHLLEETNQAYAALRADPAAWEAELAERAVWDATLLDGMDPEELWTEDGESLGPSVEGALESR